MSEVEPKTSAEFIDGQINLATWEMNHADEASENAGKFTLGGLVVGGLFSIASFVESRKTGLNNISATFSVLSATGYGSAFVGTLRARINAFKRDRYEKRVETLEAHKQFANEESEFYEEEGFSTTTIKRSEKPEVIKVENDEDDNDDESLADRIDSAQSDVSTNRNISIGTGASALLNGFVVLTELEPLRQGQPLDKNALTLYGLATVGLAAGSYGYGHSAERSKDELSELQTMEITERYHEMRLEEGIIK
jgi:hypothetical protein